MDSHQASCIDASRSRQKSVVIPQAPNRKVMARRMDSTKIDTKDDTMKISKRVENKSETKEDKNTVRTNANQNKVPKKKSIDSSSTEIEADSVKIPQHSEESVSKRSNKKEDKNTVCTDENQSKVPNKNSSTIENEDATAVAKNIISDGEWLSQDDIIEAFADVSLSEEDNKLLRYALEIVAKQNEKDLLRDVKVTIFFNTKFKRTIQHGKPSSKLFIYLNKDGNFTFNLEKPHSSKSVKGKIIFAGGIVCTAIVGAVYFYIKVQTNTALTMLAQTSATLGTGNGVTEVLEKALSIGTKCLDFFGKCYDFVKRVGFKI